MGETNNQSEVAASASFDDVPTVAVETAERATGDCLGVALYGSEQGVGDRISAYSETP